MNLTKSLLLVFIAGALGGLTSGILVWMLGTTGVTPALGFHMTPEWSLRWISGRMFASGIWGAIFLIPIYQNRAILKGIVLGVLPWLSSILVVLPYKMHAGMFGLDMGWGTPVWTLFFGCFWGVTGTLFLMKYRPNPRRP